jgi:hypothetical protein
MLTLSQMDSSINNTLRKVNIHFPVSQHDFILRIT